MIKNIALENREITKNELQIIEELNQNTPDMEEFGSILSTATLDFCVILLETFEALKEKDKEIISSLATLPFNAIQMYIEEWNGVDPNYKNYNAFVFAHPLMKDEMQFQYKLQELLSEIKEINNAFFNKNMKINRSKLGEKMKQFELVIA